MKFTAILFCLAFAFAATAQDAVTPTNHIELFNGKDFSGWTFASRGTNAAAETWTITNGVIHCTGKPSGYIRTLQNYRDYVLTIEWRFVKIAPKADNTGVLIHIQPPDKVWPMCIQNQGKSGHQGDLFLMEGAGSKEHKGMDKNTPVPMHDKSNEKNIGERDTNVTVCAGNSVKAYVNGRFMNETTECTISSGTIGIQSEGAEIEIRKVFLEPLKQ